MLHMPYRRIAIRWFLRSLNLLLTIVVLVRKSAADSAPHSSPLFEQSRDDDTKWHALAPSLNAYNDVQTLNGKLPRPLDAPISPAEAVLLVDSGYSHTTVTPLVRGRPVQAAIRRLDVGGKLMTNYLKELASIRHYNMMDETYLMNEVKEAISYVSTDFKGDLEGTWKGGLGDEERKNRSNGEVHDSILVDYVLPDYNSRRHGFVRPHDPLAQRASKARKIGSLSGEGGGRTGGAGGGGGVTEGSKSRKIS